MAINFVDYTQKYWLDSLNPPHLRPLATYLAYEKIIPFEGSPVEAVSLHDIVRASGSAIGAYVGFAVVREAGPLLFVTVPAGMVICGFTSDLAHALEKFALEKACDFLRRVRLPAKNVKPAEPEPIGVPAASAPRDRKKPARRAKTEGKEKPRPKRSRSTPNVEAEPGARAKA